MIQVSVFRHQKMELFRQRKKGALVDLVFGPFRGETESKQQAQKILLLSLA